MKTYILQKDLPNVKAGAEFEWNSTETWTSKHKEGRYVCQDTIYGYGLDAVFAPKEVENNPEWFKEKKEEKPRIERMFAKDYSDWDMLRFTLLSKLRHIEIEIKNERLAEILIAESKGEGEWIKTFQAKESKFFNDLQDKVWSETLDKKYFTEKELLDAEEKAFNAAREWQGVKGLLNLTEAVPQSQIPYKTFSDYKNSIK